MPRYTSYLGFLATLWAYQHAQMRKTRKNAHIHIIPWLSSHFVSMSRASGKAGAVSTWQQRTRECVYVCMYVCMYVFMYVCMYVFDIQTHELSTWQSCKRACLYVCVLSFYKSHSHIHTYMAYIRVNHIRTYIHIWHTYVQITFTHTYIYGIHTYKSHSHIHTYMAYATIPWPGLSRSTKCKSRSKPGARSGARMSGILR